MANYRFAQLSFWNMKNKKIGSITFWFFDVIRLNYTPTQNKIFFIDKFSIRFFSFWTSSFTVRFFIQIGHWSIFIQIFNRWIFHKKNRKSKTKKTARQLFFILLSNERTRKKNVFGDKFGDKFSIRFFSFWTSSFTVRFFIQISHRTFLHTKFEVVENDEGAISWGFPCRVM
jgi:hypothetical protein